MKIKEIENKYERMILEMSLGAEELAIEGSTMPIIIPTQNAPDSQCFYNCEIFRCLLEYEYIELINITNDMLLTEETIDE